MKKLKGRTDFRLVSAPIHQSADWMAGRDEAAKQSRTRASIKGTKNRIANVAIGKAAAEIWAKLLPARAKRK